MFSKQIYRTPYVFDKHFIKPINDTCSDLLLITSCKQARKKAVFSSTNFCKRRMAGDRSVAIMIIRNLHDGENFMMKDFDLKSLFINLCIK